jgi:hypothetical protein
MILRVDDLESKWTQYPLDEPRCAHCDKPCKEGAVRLWRERELSVWPPETVTEELTLHPECAADRMIKLPKVECQLSG